MYWSTGIQYLISSKANPTSVFLLEQNLKKYNKEHYDEYLYYTPYRRLTGLSPELTCEWKPRSPIVFDAVQLHATNKGRVDNHWTTKMGLLLTFLRQIS